MVQGPIDGFCEHSDEPSGFIKTQNSLQAQFLIAIE
jgi:hypothetical protein